ncbi:hypothetical protein LINPERPRIM_LOCUS35726, partial [Linum perenne]
RESKKMDRGMSPPAIRAADRLNALSSIASSSPPISTSNSPPKPPSSPAVGNPFGNHPSPSSSSTSRSSTMTNGTVSFSSSKMSCRFTTVSMPQTSKSCRHWTRIGLEDGSPSAGGDGGLGGGFEVEIGGDEDAVEDFVREGFESVGGSDGWRRDSEKLETIWAGLQRSLTRARGHTNPQVGTRPLRRRKDGVVGIRVDTGKLHWKR